ncbi:MAG TPA: fumarylacetoacetate hydrolase family protein [Acidimicrobiales bacterium]|nr:fumarylacetoacetate hydrolase family protein [Acidimicrobiales bacterium]
MGAVLDPPPSKVVAVHLNYRSRAAERGREPAYPSYFLKPPSSLAASGDALARPAGCELLAFEGEIALVIGHRARSVAAERGWEHVAWVTAANDFGVYDLRYADLGSNLRSKGGDGFTPIGPALLDARLFDRQSLTLRTWVNDTLVQEAAVGDELLFDFGLIVADLSRLMTLEPGDVILTGTPTGSTVVGPGDVVEVEVSTAELTTGRLRTPVVDSAGSLDAIGAMPRVDEQARAAAFGAAAATGRRADPEAPGDVSAETLRLLGTVSTATIAQQLRKKGYDSTVMEGLHALRPELHMVGRARTLSYLPFREDLFEARGGGMNAQKRAIDTLGEGDVLVIGARREHGAGTIGDILALRAKQRGAAGVITDGALRDTAAIAALGLPTFHAASNPAVLGRRHVPWETDVAVACAGVLVEPGDVVVGDRDGVVLVPPHLAAEVARDAAEQERQERFIAERVAAGESIDGLYPIGPRWRDAYERWCAADGGDTHA